MCFQCFYFLLHSFLWCSFGFHCVYTEWADLFLIFVCEILPFFYILFRLVYIFCFIDLFIYYMNGSSSSSASFVKFSLLTVEHVCSFLAHYYNRSNYNCYEHFVVNVILFFLSFSFGLLWYVYFRCESLANLFTNFKWEAVKEKPQL